MRYTKIVFLITVIGMLFSMIPIHAEMKSTDNDISNVEKDHHSPPNLPTENPLAFPGAEGGGQYATGGRGGKVYIVTSLKDDKTEGTLRHAINQRGPRIIIFNVSGTIFLKSGLKIRHADLTIAGQTAPGEGICIAGYPVVVDAHNVIIRYMRFRMGDDAGEELGDGADALEGRKQENVIIDHCSISWSTDECASFYDNKNFTMQWCIISESLRLSNHSKGPHGYGAIWGGVNATFHHNLMAHHDSRTPRFGPGVKYAGTDRVDLVNNVFYNWSGNGCYGAEAVSINIINNYYKAGPATDNKIKNQIIGINVKTEPNDFPQIHKQAGKYYITGNYFPHSPEITNDNWKGVRNSTGYPDEDINSTIPIMIDNKISYNQTAQEAYEKVLEFAGCSYHRDEIDERIVRETREGIATYIGRSAHNGEGGKWKSARYPKKGIIDSHYDTRPINAPDDWSPWPTLKTKEASLDTDGDGMPDEWEIANGLDPDTNDANGRQLSNVYDNIEVYINSLVKDITEAQYK